MDQIDYVKLLGQGGISVVALFALARIIARIGERMIAAIDRIGIKIDDHTKADTQALAAVSVHVSSLRQDFAVLASRVDTVIEWGVGERTPVTIESAPHRRAIVEDPHEDRPGEYSFRRRGG